MSNNTGIWQATFPNCPKTLTCGEWFRKKNLFMMLAEKNCLSLSCGELSLKRACPLPCRNKFPDSRLNDFIIHWFTHPFIFSSLIKLIHWFTRLLVQCVTASLIHWLIDSKIHRFIGSQVQLLSRARILSHAIRISTTMFSIVHAPHNVNRSMRLHRINCVYTLVIFRSNFIFSYLSPWPVPDTIRETRRRF